MPRSSPRRQRRNPRTQEWGAKANRQYEHVKQSQQKRGASEERAEEIAARTVNKERARTGKSKTASNTSEQDISAERRGGLRSGGGHGPGGRTKAQLYADARRQGIEGRSKMTKAELERQLRRE